MVVIKRSKSWEGATKSECRILLWVKVRAHIKVNIPVTRSCLSCPFMDGGLILPQFPQEGSIVEWGIKWEWLKKQEQKMAKVDQCLTATVCEVVSN